MRTRAARQANHGFAEAMKDPSAAFAADFPELTLRKWTISVEFTIEASSAEEASRMLRRAVAGAGIEVTL